VKELVPVMLLLIGQLFTILAIFITHRKNKELFRHQEQQKRKVKRLNEQVSGFYGPLVLLAARTDFAYSQLQTMIQDGRQSESITLAKEQLVPLNIEIISILSKNIHLMDRSDRFAVYTNYIAHADSFAYAVGKSTEYLLRPRIHYPAGFKAHVDGVYEQIRKAYIKNTEEPA
jgi:hypothetical protein